jgi:hypothetical protein
MKTYRSATLRLSYPFIKHLLPSSSKKALPRPDVCCLLSPKAPTIATMSSVLLCTGKAPRLQRSELPLRNPSPAPNTPMKDMSTKYAMSKRLGSHRHAAPALLSALNPKRYEREKHVSGCVRCQSRTWVPALSTPSIPLLHHLPRAMTGPKSYTVTKACALFSPECNRDE